MPESNHFDAIVIGAGSGGLTAAIGLARGGKRVLLVERGHIGGDCTNTGCVPSKALIARGRLAHMLARQGCSTNTVRDGALDYVRDTIASFRREETPEALEKFGIRVVLGAARFTDARTVAVNDVAYTARTIIIATGSHPRLLRIPGARTANTYTSDTIFTLRRIPDRLLVIGSGPIGLELGQAFRRLGSTVSIVSRDSILGEREEDEVSHLITQRFQEEGIDFIGNARPISFPDPRTLRFAVSEGVERTRDISFDAALVSIGRQPNLDFNPDAAGIAVGRHGIIIDTRYRTTVPHIYAIGDVAAGTHKFTHSADDAARQVVKSLLIPFPLPARRGATPKVTYIDPEVAQVGLTYREAHKRYGNRVKKIVVPFADMVDRAKIERSDGVLVLVVKRLTGTIIGAHIAHERAAELLSFFTLTIERKISLWRINIIMFPYPSHAAAIKKASDIFLEETLTGLGKELRAYLGGAR